MNLAAAPIRVVIADDHPVYRSGIAGIIKQDAGLELVGEAEDGRAALEAIRKHDPDVGRWVGTIDCASPEQIQGGDVDARADVYALGCLLFTALTGSVPVRARQRGREDVRTSERAAAVTERSCVGAAGDN